MLEALCWIVIYSITLGMLIAEIILNERVYSIVVLSVMLFIETGIICMKRASNSNKVLAV